MPHVQSLDALTDTILQVAPDPHRRLIAVCGPPGSGKSTLAHRLQQHLARLRHTAAVVPMDGFHLDNALLDTDGLRARKGAPETFDAGGFVRLVRALQGTDPVVYPRFDRARDLAVAGAERLEAGCETVLVEGNYLLYDAPVWRELRPFWSLSIALTPPRAVLRQRLVQRWLEYGYAPSDAAARADENDMRNVDLVLGHMLAPDLKVDEVEDDPLLRRGPD